MAKTKHTAKRKSAAGRPPKFATAAALQKAVNAYFKDREPTKDNPAFTPPTLAGLAVHLDFADFSTFKDYEGNPKFSHVLKKAKMRIAAVHVVDDAILCCHLEHSPLIGSVPHHNVRLRRPGRW